MPESVSEIGVRLSLDASNFNSGLKSAQANLSGFQAQAAKAGSAAAAGRAGAAGPAGGTAAATGSVKAGVEITPASLQAALANAGRGLAPIHVPITVSKAAITAMRESIIAGLGSIPVNITPTFAKSGPQSLTNIIGSVLSMQYGITQTQGRQVFKSTVERALGPMPKGMATGGHVMAGMPLIVGEKRPELFVPSVAGRIFPDIRNRDAMIAYLVAQEQQRAQQSKLGPANIVIPRHGGGYARQGGGDAWRGNIAFQLGDMHPDLARRIENQVRHLSSRYPLATPGRVAYEPLLEEGLLARYFVGARPKSGMGPRSGGSIVFNQSHLKDFIDPQGRLTPSSFLAVPNIEGVTTHEFGHGVESALWDHLNKYSVDLRQQGWEQPGMRRSRLYQQLSNKARGLSDYAKRSAEIDVGGELFAEAFAAMEHGMRLPGVGHEMSAWLDQIKGKRPRGFAGGGLMRGAGFSPGLRKVAQEYNAAAGFPRMQEQMLHPLSPDFSRRTALAYEGMPADADQISRLAYRAFADETMAQHAFLRSKGFEFLPSLSDPYTPSGGRTKMQLAGDDVSHNKRLLAFASSLEHPLLTNEENLAFRHVHDMMGHLTEGFSIGPRGEYNAAVKHSQMYSPLAQMAMLAETHGQNSVVNFSPTILAGMSKSIAEINAAAPGTIYADQKARVLPDDILREFYQRTGTGRHGGGPCAMCGGGHVTAMHAMAGKKVAGSTELARYGPQELMEANIWAVVNRMSPADIHMGKVWYGSANKIAQRAMAHTGYGDLDRALAMVAATSPRTLFASNMAHAATMMEAGTTGRYPTKADADRMLPLVGQWIQAEFGNSLKIPKGASGLFRYGKLTKEGIRTPSSGEKAYRLATTNTPILDLLRGPKVVPFHQNLGGNLNALTLDALAAQVATGGAYMDSPGSGVFRDTMRDAYLAVHAQLPKHLRRQLPSIAQLQAATWVTWRGAGMQAGGPADFERRAFEMFGTTDDPKRAGWLTPSGKYLDFSHLGSGTYQRSGRDPHEEQAFWGPGASRTIPHRAARHLMDPGMDLAATYEGMMDRGYLRMADFRGGGFAGEMSSPLSMPQIRRLITDLKEHEVEDMLLDLNTKAPATNLGTFRSILAYDRASAGQILQTASQFAQLGQHELLPQKGKYWNRAWGKAGGGQAGGGLYIVGEIGDELFVPDHMRQLIPKKVMDQLPGMSGGGPMRIGTRRNELFAPPTDGVIIPHRLMDQVGHLIPGAAEGRERVRGAFGRGLGGSPFDPLPARERRELARALGIIPTTPTGGATAGEDWTPLPPAPPSTATSRYAEHLAAMAALRDAPAIPSTPPPDPPSTPAVTMYTRHLEALATISHAPPAPPAAAAAPSAAGRAGLLAALGGAGGRPPGGAAAPPGGMFEEPPPGKKGKAAAVEMGLPQEQLSALQRERESLSLTAQLQAARTPQGVAAVLGAFGLGGRRAAIERIAEERRTGREMEMAARHVPTEKIKEYNALEERLVLTRGKTADAIKAEMETMQEGNVPMQNWVRAHKAHDDAIAKGIPGIGAAARNFGAIILATSAYGLAISAASTVFEKTTPVIGTWIDQFRGWTATSSAVTTALSEQNRQAMGNIEVTQTQSATTAGLSVAAKDFIDSQLGMTTQVKTGAEALKETEDLFKAAIGAGGSPEGLGKGYGGFVGNLLAPKTGAIESLAGIFQNIQAQAGVQAGAGPAGVPFFLDPGWWTMTKAAGFGTGIQGGQAGRGADMQGFFEAGLENINAAEDRAVEEYKRQGMAPLAGVEFEAARGPKQATRFAESVRAAAQTEGLSDDARDALKLFADAAESSQMIIRVGGKTATTVQQFVGALQQTSVGAGLPDLAVVMEEEARRIAVQEQAATEQQRYQTGTAIPFGLAQQLLQQPLIGPGVGAPRVGVSAGARGAIADVNAITRAAQGDMQDAATQAVKDMAGFIGDNLGEAAQGQFEGLMGQADDLSGSIEGLTKSMLQAQQAASEASYANQLRLANRGLGDAIGLLGKAGGTRLGYLQREEFLLSRASQRLGLQSQVLSLRGQEISIASTKLNLALQARQIATQLALAQFQAPGESGEERFARQREAILRARIEQRQLGFGRQQVGISEQQLALQGRQVGIAQKQFVVAGQVWGENARRAAVDARRAIDVMQTARDAEAKIVSFQRGIGAATAEMGQVLAKAGTFVSRAENRFGDNLQTAASAAIRLVRKFDQAWEILDAAIKDQTTRGETGTSAKTSTGKTGRDGSALGVLAMASGPTEMLVGEAGRETVAILRNPRMESLGGGGGGSHVTINIVGASVRDDRDIENLARKVAHHVERSLSHKGQMLGLRQPAY